MKKNHFVLAFSLLALLLCGTSCSSEGEPLSGGPDTTVPDGSEGIRIVVHTPAPDDIVLSRAVADEAEEYAVKKLGVYLFLAESESAAGDTDYKLAYQASALEAGGGDGQFTDGGNGTLSYTLPIQADWLGKSAKIALVANDEVSGLSENTTTLVDFKQSLSTAKLSGDDSSADVISGNIYATDATTTATGLPMSALAQTDGKDAFVITPLGAELSASLQRIMARIDVRNQTPNLTIIGLKMEHAAAQGYLFPQETTAAPAETGYYTLLPTGLCKTDLDDGGLPYEEEGDAPKTHKHVFYLYEQVNALGASAQVVIDYTLKIGEVTKEGSVSVPLKTDDETYVPTTRNNLYTIVIGSGKPIEDGVAVTKLVVNDWEATTDIGGELQPGSGDEDFVPGEPKDLSQLAVGDYYMSDGTVRDGKTITPDAYPYVTGVVFQTYSEDTKTRFEANMRTLGGSTLTTPHGLVMAVKNANNNTSCQWKIEKKDEEGLMYMETLVQAYSDVNGYSNYDAVAKDDEHPVFKAVSEFGKIIEAPASSTGWFLPSSGQWWDIVANLGGMTIYMQPQQSDVVNPVYFWYYDNSTSSSATQRPIDVTPSFANSNINLHLTSLGRYADQINDDIIFWTSSEYSDMGARNVYFSASHLVFGCPYKTEVLYVRAILAF